MENHPFLRSLVVEGGSSGTGRLASTRSSKSEAGAGFDAELSGRLREREVAEERVEARRATLGKAREARNERSERRTRSSETAESARSTQATDEARETRETQAEVESGSDAAKAPEAGCGESCAETTPERPTGAERAETKPAKAVASETQAVAPQVDGEPAPATETLGVQLGQGKGLEAPTQLGSRPNGALERANEAADAPQVELELAGDAPASADAATESAQPTAGEEPLAPAQELASAVEKLDGAARQDTTNTPATPREVAPREVSATRPEVEAAKNLPRNEAPVSAERAADMLRQIRLQLSPELRQATIQLEPRELGRISVKVTLRGGVAHAELRVEKREALEALQKQIPELEAALERAGLGGGELSLQLGLEERSGRDEAPADLPTRRSLHFHAPASMARALSARLPATSGIDTYA